MNITEIAKKCKRKFELYEKDIFMSILVILTGFLGFGIGKLSNILENKIPIEIQNAVNSENIENSFNNEFNDINKQLESNNNKNQQSNLINSKIDFNNINKNAEKELNFVASKNGKKYYFPWCKGVEKIKEKNKIWFFSKEEAARAGYEPAKNCKGL